MSMLTHIPFKYERIGDMADNTGLGDFIYTMDNKSGYWQVPMHESMYINLGMQWGGAI